MVTATGAATQEVDTDYAPFHLTACDLPIPQVTPTVGSRQRGAMPEDPLGEYPPELNAGRWQDAGAHGRRENAATWSLSSAITGDGAMAIGIGQSSVTKPTERAGFRTQLSAKPWGTVRGKAAPVGCDRRGTLRVAVAVGAAVSVLLPAAVETTVWLSPQPFTRVELADSVTKSFSSTGNPTPSDNSVRSVVRAPELPFILITRFALNFPQAALGIPKRAIEPLPQFIALPLKYLVDQGNDRSISFQQLTQLRFPLRGSIFDLVGQAIDAMIGFLQAVSRGVVNVVASANYWGGKPPELPLAVPVGARAVTSVDIPAFGFSRTLPIKNPAPIGVEITGIQSFFVQPISPSADGATEALHSAWLTVATGSETKGSPKASAPAATAISNAAAKTSADPDTDVQSIADTHVTQPERNIGAAETVGQHETYGS